MWKSNVSKLRRCFSAVPWHIRRSYSSSLPITTAEFHCALRSLGGRDVYDELWARNRRSLGFAVSGGVDSMALALLFAQSREAYKLRYPEMNLEGTPPDHAFIVDHRVRPESTEEANWVAEQCRSQFGMQATVLPLTWPAKVDALSHKRFETDARTLRYQALGRACRAEGISDLLVAHHADDQAETVLMRLANNRLRSGLQAMQPIEWIPECSGIYGVSHSGAPQEHCARDPSHRTRSLCETSLPIGVEAGGVRVLRPLLDFEKSRLIATCEKHGVAWAEDKTNLSRTYTSRNAVRHILKHHKLPAALSIPSLVNTSSHMRRRVDMHKSKAQDLFRKCSKQLDVQTGSLLIQFPPFHMLLDGCVPGPTDPYPVEVCLLSEWTAAKNTAICLVAEAAQMVSPKESPSLGELASTVANIWPEWFGSSETGHSKSTHSFCIHGVWWRKWGNSSYDDSNPLHPPVHGKWLLTRQPLGIHRATAASESIQYPPLHVLPRTQDNSDALTDSKKDYLHDDYQLFDGRWWIKVGNNSSDTLILRHFTKADLDRMSSLQPARGGKPKRHLDIALSMIKPADVRFTLPALFRQDTVTKKETLIGFPTLDVSIGQLGYPNDVCSWRVNYKKLGYESELCSHAFESPAYHSVSSVTHERLEQELANSTKISNKKPPKSDEQTSMFSNTLWGPTEVKSANISRDPSHDIVRIRRQSPSALAAHYTRLMRLGLSSITSNGRDSGAVNENEARSSASSKKTTNSERTVPLRPIAESKRRGRSEKQKGGGYRINWDDFGNRVD